MTSSPGRRTTSRRSSGRSARRPQHPQRPRAATTATLTAAAATARGGPAALALLAGLPLLAVSTRWYLRRAPRGYRRERATYARLNGVITETVDGAATVDALDLAAARRREVDDALRSCFAAERYTLALRTRWYPVIETGYLLPVAASVLWGGVLVNGGYASVSEVTTVALLAVRLVDPMSELVAWLDELQVGAASLARMIGVAEVAPDRTASGAQPDGTDLVVTGVRYAYRPGVDVLHGIDLAVAPGERLAVVGPSGAGKSTLGRLLAGVHPPRAGSVHVGGVPVTDLPLPRLHQEVALMTQEHHVFVGTLADNLRLADPEADDAALVAALTAVDALAWFGALPARPRHRRRLGRPGAHPAAGTAGRPGPAAGAAPHPRAGRGDVAAGPPVGAPPRPLPVGGLAGRSVVAIAHRLHTAHDADRVAVVEAGRVVELGSHDELAAAGGSYASAVARLARAGPRRRPT